MLVAASGYIHEQVGLITLGHTCRYLAGTADNAVLFDVGLSGHVEPLLRRLGTIGISSIDKVVLTHLHPDRIAGVAMLRRRFSNLRLVGSPEMQDRLSNSDFVRLVYEEDLRLSQLFAHVDFKSLLSFEEFNELIKIDSVIKDSDLLQVAPGMEARVFSCPGHTAESLAFLLLPSHYLITDEGFGYHRGRDPVAPGGDESLRQEAASLKRFEEHEILGLCLPYVGALTGTLVAKHLTQLLINIDDLQRECEKAFQDNLAPDYIKDTVRAGFYTSDSRDPLLQQALAASFEAIWHQIGPEQLSSPASPQIS
jgi:glyoxylase-like metal-dependent hydrolase (beta-lactamase superfamily II)